MKFKQNALRNYKSDEIKPQVEEIEFPDGKKLILLSQGRLVNLRKCHRTSQFCYECIFYKSSNGTT